VVDNGSDTLFWRAPKLDVVSLGDRFSWLYDLSLTKVVMVADIHSLGWGLDIWCGMIVV